MFAQMACVDLLVAGVGELAGGSLRENDPQRLEAAIRAQLKSRGDTRVEVGARTGTGAGAEAGAEALQHPHPLQWYIDLRRAGLPPHGGFGLGIERLLVVLLGLRSVRDVVPFPRYVNSCRL